MSEVPLYLDHKEPSSPLAPLQGYIGLLQGPRGVRLAGPLE